MNIHHRESLLIGVGLIAGFGCRQTPAPQMPPLVPRRSQLKAANVLEPDQETRQEIKPIHAARITSMCVYGPDYDHYANDPIVITDTKTIHRILHALNDAEIPTYLGIADQADTLLIYTKPANTSHEPLQFDFNPKFAARCYGPEFYQVLRTTPTLRQRDDQRKLL